MKFNKQAQPVYVQNTYTGVVYKKMLTHYLQLSPWSQGDDRRITELDYDNCSVINYKNACMIINKQFNSIDEQWDNHGKLFKASKIPEDTDVNERTLMLKSLPSHTVKTCTKQMLKEIEGDTEISIKNDQGEFKLVRHKGKLYYILIIDEYLPRVQAYNMFGEFLQWVGIQHVKPVFNMTDKKFV